MHLKSRRADALIYYLCLSSETVHSRESLACLLWQEADAQHSRGSLRQLLRRIKQKCPGLDEVFKVDRNQIVVHHSQIDLDLHAFQRDLGADLSSGTSSPAAIDLDEFLADCSGLSNAMDSWISITRNRIETNLRDTLAAAFEFRDRPLDQRIRAAQALLQLDPAHEPSCRFLMRANAEAGNPGAALRIYNDLYAFLGDEFDVEPSEETIELVALVKLGEVKSAKPVPDQIAPLPAAQTTAPPPATATPEIFVCAFEFGTDSRHLADVGRVFRYELLANLTSFREWRIYDIEPARDNCYRLEGIFNLAGKDVVLIATLKQEADNRVIWSERFQINFEDWQHVQHRMAQQLSVAINSGVSANRLSRCLSSGLEDQTVFDKWVLAQSLLLEWRPEQTNQGLSILKEITQEAPRFGPAHTWLSTTENIRPILYPGCHRPKAGIETSLYHARLAIEIDPMDSRAHLAAAWSYAMNQEFEVSRFHFDQTIDLNPNSILTRMSCALGYGFLGDVKLAVEIAENAQELARSLPPFLWGYLLNIYYLDNQLDKAIRAGALAGHSITNLQGWQAAALWELGDTEAAGLAGREFAQCVRDSWSAETPASDTEIVNWFIQCFPLRQVAQSNRLRQGVAAALRVQ
ncbi:BTAD domain-containing putative transcriptional regulator [Pseudophaeobacter sp.]|uniref:BTAD domain-containing putative transcriptional regulator n=1 Tax=Pseudophaeobacter sp. TaxID=1971739 RepID=UPI00329760BE